jgi:hypothetical protein
MARMPSSPTPPDRREFLTSGASWIGAAALAGNSCAAGAARSTSSGTSDGDELDAALERLHAQPLDANIHASNHVPMVVEALGVLGRETAIQPWFDAHHAPGTTPAETRGALAAREWRDALARPERFLDWQMLFLRELENEDWKRVVGVWAPRLAPGLAGAATHGLIRTGHAARAVAARDSAIRRRELATGLAYWAVSYQELPWDGTLAPEPSVEAALAKVELRRPKVEPPRGNIVSGLASLDDTPSFRPVAGLIDTRDPLRTLHEITAAFARLFLANPERQIAFTHAVTAPSALRLLLPALDEETARTATRLAWQAAAGLYVVYGDPRRPAVAATDTYAESKLIDDALAVGDPHAIKLTEACLREEAVAPDPSYRAAAHAISAAMKG